SRAPPQRRSMGGGVDPCPRKGRTLHVGHSSLISSSGAMLRGGDLARQDPAEAATSGRPSLARLHATPVLPAHVEERARDLPERADPDRFHQRVEYVAVIDHRLLEPF